MVIGVGVEGDCSKKVRFCDVEGRSNKALHDQASAEIVRNFGCLCQKIFGGADVLLLTSNVFVGFEMMSIIRMKKPITRTYAITRSQPAVASQP